MPLPIPSKFLGKKIVSIAMADVLSGHEHDRSIAHKYSRELHL